jgi:hypothetical protein
MKIRLAAILALAALLAVAAWWFRGRSPGVTLTLANETARPIAWVAVEHERGGERVDHLAPHATRVVRFRSRGETSFRVRVHFDDGAEYSRGSTYAESGYRFHVALRDSGLTMNTGLPAY